MLSTTSIALFSGCVLLYMIADTKFCSSFRTMLKSGGVQPILLPPRSPNLNAFAERWVRSIKDKCLTKLILFCEASLRRTATEFTDIITTNAITKAKRTGGSFQYLLLYNHTLSLRS